MTPQLPLDDPSRSTSFAARVVVHVRQAPVLRLALYLTLADHVASLLLLAAGRLSGGLVAVLLLLSLFTWFFAVLLPLMNREVLARAGGARGEYFAELVEMFCRVVLCAQTAFFTYVLAVAALGRS
ncbi:MAG: hypothetical protein ACREID_01845 [Planctomycetota bacterium]